MSKRMRYLMVIMILLIMAGLFMVTYLYYLTRLPDRINLTQKSEQQINFSVPVKGKIVPQILEAASMQESRAGEVSVDFSRPVNIMTGGSENYLAKLKLFGVLPYKDVAICVSDEKMVVPCGVTVGIYMQTQGVMVIDTGKFEGKDGKEIAPADHVLEAGDYILSVNGSPVQKKQEFMDYVAQCNGEALEILLNREGTVMTQTLQPQEDSSGKYKVGIWIRDSTQGIGTITYIDGENRFGALGHGVTDVDTGELMDLEDGSIYLTEIVSIEKGQHGTPGEMTGMIHYVSENIVGTIRQNDASGIYGEACADLSEKAGKPPVCGAVPLAYKGEVHEGAAEIITDVSGELKRYDINITGINPANTDHRGLNLEITDRELIDLTGGIVQGMSGSPILQDGKLVGAVTHVLVNDPAKGYGIFIEDMVK